MDANFASKFWNTSRLFSACSKQGGAASRSQAAGFLDRGNSIRRTIKLNDPEVNRISFGRVRPRKKKQRQMTNDNLINSVASNATARYQAMTSSDVASFDIARVDLDGNDGDEDHYWRIRSRRAPRTVAESFAALVNC
jgi:hypothetical protein